MNILADTVSFEVAVSTSHADVTEAQRLRYKVFATEFGAHGDGIDHTRCLEHDAYDAVADHLVLKDRQRPEGSQIVGVYRLMQGAQAAKVGDFYSAAEYDLRPLKSSGCSLLEMSRSCVHPDYRGGTALLHLWQGLAAYIAEHDIDVVFGVASFAGATIDDHKASLALLHQDHLAPAQLRPKSTGESAVASSVYAETPFSRRDAMIAMPALIKAYLRMGGVVGDGAFQDKAFGTTDVCMILETAQLTARQRAFLGALCDG